MVVPTSRSVVLLTLTVWSVPVTVVYAVVLTVGIIVETTVV